MECKISGGRTLQLPQRHHIDHFHIHLFFWNTTRHLLRTSSAGMDSLIEATTSFDNPPGDHLCRLGKALLMIGYMRKLDLMTDRGIVPCHRQRTTGSTVWHGYKTTAEPKIESISQTNAYKNTQVATSLLTSCNNLLQQADIRMRLHGLWQLIDDKSVASCQPICCKLIVKLVIHRLAASCFNKL